MDSKKPRVSTSASRVAAAAPGGYLHARTLSAGSPSTVSVPIRAPLTLDDDDEEDGDNSDFESNARKSVRSYCSNTSSTSYSSEIDESGTEQDEGFESASIGPDDETAERSAVLDGDMVFRQFEGDPDDETARGSAFSGVFRVFRPFAGYTNEETSEMYSSLGEEESESGGDVDEDMPNARIVVPRAKLSMDDDEIDGIVGSEGEDDRFSGVAKVPSINTVPSIEFSGVKGGEDEEDEEDESLELGEAGSVGKEFLVSVSGEFVFGGEETVDGNDSADGSVLIDSSVEEKGHGVMQENQVESLVSNEEDSVRESLELDKKVEKYAEERPMLGNIGEEMVQRNSSHSFDDIIKPVEAFVGKGSKELEDEEGKVSVRETVDCPNSNLGGVVSETEKPESERGQPEIDSVDSQISQLNLMQGSLSLGNSEMLRTEDAIVSYKGLVEFPGPSSTLDAKVKSESESEADKDSGKIEKNLLLSDEDVKNSTFLSPNEMAKEITVKEEQISRLIYSQVVLESADEANQDSGKIEKNALLSDDVNNLKPDNSVEMSNEELKNEEQISRLIHNHVVMEPDEDEEVNDRGKGSSDSAAEPRSSEESSFEHLTFDLGDEGKESIEKMQLTRVKFLRLIKRLGFSPADSVVDNVLYKLAPPMGKYNTVHGFVLESDKAKAIQLEEEGKDDLDFSLHILVLGKTGVGKSATVNTIFGQIRSAIGAFGPTTSSIKEIDGTVDGVKIRILDTPGLRSSAKEERINKKILSSIKKHMNKFPTDIVLYIDRLDEHSGNFSDIQLLRSITSSLGSSIWQNAIVVLTHAASGVQDLSYEAFVARRSFLVQQSISQAVGDLSFMNPSLMPEVVLAENTGEPSGQKEIGACQPPNWRRQLLLLCCTVKILSEASSLLKPKNRVVESRHFGSRLYSFSLFSLLWNISQPRAHPRLSSGKSSDNFDSEYYLEEKKAIFSNCLVEMHRKVRKNAYFDDYEFHVKKQQRGEMKRLREMKKNAENGENDILYVEDEIGFEERRNLDCVYGGIGLERRNRVAGNHFPFGFQVEKGKKELKIHLDPWVCEADLKTRFSVDQDSRMLVGVGTNKERGGRISIKASGLEQMQIAVFGVLPLIISMFRSVHGGYTEKHLR